MKILYKNAVFFHNLKVHQSTSERLLKKINVLHVGVPDHFFHVISDWWRQETGEKKKIIVSLVSPTSSLAQAPESLKKWNQSQSRAIRMFRKNYRLYTNVTYRVSPRAYWLRLIRASDNRHRYFSRRLLTLSLLSKARTHSLVFFAVLSSTACRLYSVVI